MNSSDKRKARLERKALKKQLKEEAKQKKKGVFSGFGSSSSTSSYTGSSSTSTGTSTSSWGANWWVKDYGTKKTGEAVSSYWTSRLDNSWYGGYGTYSYTKADGTDFAAVLNSIRRSANIVTNAEKNGENKEERELLVKWAQTDKDRNTAKGQDIFLSPSVVDKNTTKKKAWSDDERADVLIGEALVQSTMKHTVDAETEKTMCEGSSTKRGHLENAVWTVAEHLFAEKEVLENYPGFKGYFAANRAYYTGTDTKKTFEGMVGKAETESKLDPTGATSGFLWDLLHPSDPLETIPDRMKEFINWSKERLSTETSSEGRSKAAKEIVTQAYKLFQVGDDDGSESIGEGEGIEEWISEPGISELGRDEEIEFETVDEVLDNPKKTSAKDPHGVPPNLEGSDWHGGTIDYKVRGDEVSYSKLVQQLTPLIRDVRNRIKIRAEENRLVEHALKKGRLDEGSIYKIGFSKFDYHDEKLFEQEEIISMPEVAFGILVDESGSMSGRPDAKKTKAQYAKEICIILAEALKGIDGVQLGVWGHTCEGQYQGGTVPNYEELAIHQYYTPEHPEMSSLSRISAFANNIDGYAIAYVAKQMDKYYQKCATKVLIHISDGQPAGSGYGGAGAMNHMLGVSKLAKQKGIRVIGIGVCNAFSQSAGNAMYGPGNFVILNGMTGFQSVITNLVTRVANSRF